jgi:hypothetical protein
MRGFFEKRATVPGGGSMISLSELAWRLRPRG